MNLRNIQYFLRKYKGILLPLFLLIMAILIARLVAPLVTYQVIPMQPGQCLTSGAYSFTYVSQNPVEGDPYAVVARKKFSNNLEESFLLLNNHVEIPGRLLFFKNVNGNVTAYAYFPPLARLRACSQ